MQTRVCANLRVYARRGNRDAHGARGTPGEAGQASSVNPKHETRNPKIWAYQKRAEKEMVPERSTLTPKPETLAPQPNNRTPQSITLYNQHPTFSSPTRHQRRSRPSNPKLSTLISQPRPSKPQTHVGAPRTLDRKPCTVCTKPKTPNVWCTPNPKPHTRNLGRGSRNRSREGR